jgi:hypothetical protein
VHGDGRGPRVLRYKEPASGPWRGDKKPGAGLRYCATVTAPYGYMPDTVPLRSVAPVARRLVKYMTLGRIASPVQPPKPRRGLVTDSTFSGLSGGAVCAPTTLGYPRHRERVRVKSPLFEPAPCLRPCQGARHSAAPRSNTRSPAPEDPLDGSIIRPGSIIPH